MEKMNLFLELQLKQYKEGTFISQTKELIKHLELDKAKEASTPVFLHQNQDEKDILQEQWSMGYGILRKPTVTWLDTLIMTLQDDVVVHKFTGWSNNLEIMD